MLICDRAPAWKQRFQREKQYAAKVTQNASGEYVVQLNLVDGNVARLSIDLPVPEHAHGRAHGPPLARMCRQGISAIVESAL